MGFFDWLAQLFSSHDSGHAEPSAHRPIVVRAGDTLAALAAEHGFDWRLAKIRRGGRLFSIGTSGITPETIRPGDIVLPQWAQDTPEPSDSGAPAAETCDVLTADLLGEIFPNAPTARLANIAQGLNFNINTGQIDTENRLANFMGQVREEIGPTARLEENMNYSVSALKKIFSVYRRNPALANAHGRKTGQSANVEAIANHAYAGRIGNGNIASGDGWRYRGRGLKQLTGRANYADFTEKHRQIWGGSEDFIADPDLLLQPVYAVRSGLYFWVEHTLSAHADQGTSAATVNAITDKINPHASGSLRTNRVQHVAEIAAKGLFSNLCFNTTRRTSNPQAENPQ